MSLAPYSSGDPETAKYVIVGEAPGAEEEQRGGAFIGTAGRLLDDLLRNAGISRDEIYFDNVFQFRPTNNDVSPYIKFAKTVTETEKFVQAQSSLAARLETTKANVIITMGNVPTYTVTSLTPITKQRGSVVPATLLKDRKVIPCIHPAAALREYLSRYNIVNDLRRAKDQAEFPEVKHLTRDLILSPSFSDAMSFLDTCNKSVEPIAYDIEIRGQELSHIAFAINPHVAICIPFVEGIKDYWAPDQEATIMLKIAEVLENPKIDKIGQNLSFDATFMYYKYGIHVAPLQDTMIASGILFPDLPKGLDFLVSIYCEGEPYYKDDGKEWFRNPFASEEAFRRYNAMDAAVLMEIFPQQIKELRKIGNTETYRRQNSLLHPLVYAGNKGIRMDTKKMETAGELCDDRIAALTRELADVTGRSDLNPNSPKQLKEYFYVDKGVKPYTRKGAISVDDKALKRLAMNGWKEADIILKLRHERKMLGTYYNMKLDEDGRMRCSFNPVGTEQGRISSSKTIRGTGANLQNQPAETQAMMLSDPGYILINQDLGQAENRVVAYISGEQRMINSFEKGIDIHKQTGSLISEIPIDEVTEDQRSDGKKANHGLNYDLGYKSFALIYQMPEKKAKFIVDRYHSVYPSVREWHNSVREELSRQSRTLMNCYGRKRIFLDRWGHDLFKVAYSYCPQSTVAEKMNQDGVIYLYNRQDLFPEVQFLNTIHDSIRYQIPLSAGYERIIEIVKRMKSSLEKPISWRGQTFSIPADTELGFSYDKSTMIEWKARYVDDSNEGQLAEELDTYVREQAT